MSCPMRISKFPQATLTGLDMHCLMPPQVPPTPPPPAPPVPVPSAPWVPLGINMGSQLIFGKFTFVKTATEGLGDILMGHDYGMPQPHIPCPPYTATPSIATVMFGASHKYFLPSYAVQETPNGGAIAMAGASGSAVAVSTPAFLIPVQDCMDAMQVGFVAPSGISMQLASTRWVGFGASDLFAGMIAMAGDAAGAAIGSSLGNALTSGMGAGASLIAGGALNMVTNILGTHANANATNAGETAGAAVALAATGIFAGAVPGLVAGKLADAVGGSPRPEDRDPAFNTDPVYNPPASGS